MEKQFWVFLCGFHSLFFAVFHVCFWKLFRWKTELPKLSSLNAAIMQVLNLRIIYVAFLMAFLCFFYPTELYATELGRAVLIGFSLFWAARTAEQFLFFAFNQVAAFVFTGLFVLGSVLFLLPLF